MNILFYFSVRKFICLENKGVGGSVSCMNLAMWRAAGTLKKAVPYSGIGLIPLSSGSAKRQFIFIKSLSEADKK